MDFHARFSATGRRYTFRLVARRAPVTHDRGLVWQVLNRLDLSGPARRRGAADREPRLHHLSVNPVSGEKPGKDAGPDRHQRTPLSRRRGIPVRPRGPQLPAQSGPVDCRNAGTCRCRGLDATRRADSPDGEGSRRLRAGFAAAGPLPRGSKLSGRSFCKGGSSVTSSLLAGRGTNRREDEVERGGPDPGRLRPQAAGALRPADPSARTVWR
jgi:hypothetical protein